MLMISPNEVRKFLWMNWLMHICEVSSSYIVKFLHHNMWSIFVTIVTKQIGVNAKANMSVACCQCSLCLEGTSVGNFILKCWFTTPMKFLIIWRWFSSFSVINDGNFSTQMLFLRFNQYFLRNESISIYLNKKRPFLTFLLMILFFSVNFAWFLNVSELLNLKSP